VKISDTKGFKHEHTFWKENTLRIGFSSDAERMSPPIPCFVLTTAVPREGLNAVLKETIAAAV
jgi:hypothetical protein